MIPGRIALHMATVTLPPRHPPRRRWWPPIAIALLTPTAVALSLGAAWIILRRLLLIG